MREKKEIQLNKKETKFIIGVILIPLLLTFVLEHFGEFSATALGSINDPNAIECPIMDVRLDTRTFKTIFGNKITENLYSKNIRAYRETKDFRYTTSPVYIERIPYYLKGVYADIFFPLTLSVIIIAIYFFRKKFKIKFVDNNEN